MDAISFLKQHFDLSEDQSWTDVGASIKIDKVRSLMEAYADYKIQSFKQKQQTKN